MLLVYWGFFKSSLMSSVYPFYPFLWYPRNPLWRNEVFVLVIRCLRTFKWNLRANSQQLSEIFLDYLQLKFGPVLYRVSQWFLLWSSSVCYHILNITRPCVSESCNYHSDRFMRNHCHEALDHELLFFDFP
jgi:hypothetical protein